MFDDPRKELEKLEKQLLKDEAWFEKELDSAKRMIGQNRQKSRQATAPRTPQAPQAAVKSAPAKAPDRQSKTSKKEVSVPKKKSSKGLVILMLLETLGILGLGAYWVLFLLK